MRITRMNAVLLARKLRKNQTPTEQKVWCYLRNRKYRRIKFLRQHPFYYDNINGNTQFFIIDFYCAEFKLIIELDGEIHNLDEIKSNDKDRDQIISEGGFKVVRIKNQDVTTQESFYKILDEILCTDFENLRNEFDF